MCYDVCCDEENNAHIFIGFYSELASENVCSRGKEKWTFQQIETIQQQ